MGGAGARCVPLARAVGNREDEAFAQINLGSLASELAYHDRAATHLAAGLALARAASLPAPTVLALHNLGNQAWLDGNAAESLRCLEEALILARAHEITWLVPNILLGLGFATTDLGDHARAAAYLREGLELGHSRGNPGDVIEALEGLARLCAATGQLAQAVRLFGGAATLREEIATPYVPSEHDWIDPTLETLRAGLGRGPRLLLLRASRSARSRLRAGWVEAETWRQIDRWWGSRLRRLRRCGWFGRRWRNCHVDDRSARITGEKRQPTNSKQECREHDRGRDDQRLHLPCTSPRTGPWVRGRSLLP